jgi:hypothetical protein
MFEHFARLRVFFELPRTKCVTTSDYGLRRAPIGARSGCRVVRAFSLAYRRDPSIDIRSAQTQAAASAAEFKPG